MGLTVYTGGTYDLIHSGHVSFLRQCALLGQVTISLNTDDFIKKYKGKEPVMSYDERFEVLSEFRCVNSIIPNTGGMDSKVAIEQVKPHIIAIGSDWAKKDYYAQMGFTQDWLDEQDIMLLYIPYTKGISTTELKRRMQVN